MNNAAGASPTPLSVFGGAVTEMAPSDLPEGASPFNQDVDYLPGSVFTRGGRANQMSYGNLSVESICGIGASTPVGNPAAWLNPNNVSKNLPGVYASATVNQPVAGYLAPAFRFAFSNDAVSMTTLNIVQTQNPLPGSTLVVILSSTHFDPAQPNPIFTSVTDTRGNVYSLIYSQDVSPIGQNMKTSVFTAKSNNVGGGNTVTAHTVNGTTTFLMGTVMEYTASNAFQLEAANFQPNASGGGASNFTASAPVTTTGGVDLLLGIVQYGSTNVSPPLGADPSFTIRSQFWENGTIGWALGVTDRFAMAPGTYTDDVFTNTTNSFALITLAFKLIPTPSPTTTQILSASQFTFNIPLAQRVTGIEIELFGNQSILSADAIVSGSIPGGGGTTFSAQLPASDGTVAIIGTPTASFGVPITPALLNNPAFTINLVASAAGGVLTTFNIYAVKVKVFLSPFPPANVNWLKTYEQTSGQTDTLVLDGNGILWDENVTSGLGVLNSIYTAINPGSFAKSVTFQNTEYIAFSDLLQGTDMPRQWNGTNLDRLSQAAPGAPPSFGTTATGSSISSITQNSPFLLIPNGTNPNAWLGVGAGAGINAPTSPGNVMTIFLQSTDIPPAYFVVGGHIQLSGFPTLNGNVVNNDPTGVTNPAYYTITSISQQIPGESARDWISFQVPFTTFYNQRTPGGCQIQSTEATMTTPAQVPYLEVGNQFTLTGVTPAGWNNTFRVTRTPNAAVLQIVNTSLTNNVGQYVFNLQSGALPQVGQFINVNGTLNGGGIFNVLNAVVASVTANTFTVNITSPNISGVAETNSTGSIYGTKFVFDPAGTVTNPIIGNAGGVGSIASSGVIGVGIRKGVCIFKTRNGALTGTSPFAQFNITASASAIVAGSIPIGPPDTIARIIAFTGAGGGNFFWIPAPVTVTSNGQQITYAATIINDNTTTQATFSFPDAVLLAATAIDIQGNNLFAQIELGSSRGLLSYAGRVIAWGEQNKIQNLLNLSFDGGIGTQSLQQLATQPQVTSYPLGWTVDTVNGRGGSLVVSPLFGNAYYIKNSTGSTQNAYGMIEQAASLNQLGTPIVFPSTTYSCRLAARSPSGSASGFLVVDLWSPVLSQVFGSFLVPLNTLTSNYKIFSGTLLTNPFGIVPKDLILRVWAFNIPNGGDVEIDRVEPFPTTQPSFSTQFHASYAFNQEAFDLVTGLFGPAQNQQKCNGGMVLFDSLYMLKESSWYSTSDNGVTEPYKWNWREVSNKVGTIGINSYDYGEGWGITACRAGAYFFDGGEPVKFSQEIQSLWDLINWKAGATIWMRNDETTKSIKIGVPIPTPNKFMPEFPVNANPQSPNVVLQMSYRELNSGAMMASTGPIKSTYSGRLMSPEPARKWSFWNLASPYADFVDRGDNTKPIFYGSGYTDNKIFKTVDGQLHDDGNAINSFYLTYGFVKEDIGEARGIGVLRAQLSYLLANLSGTGDLNTLIYPEDPANPLPFILDTTPLDPISQGLNELVVGGLTGNRFFIRMGTNAVGSAFALSEIVAVMQKDPWSEVRGTTSGLTQ